MWWAGPTALALLGASAVSLVLVPGPGDSTKVPVQVVVDERGTPATPPRADHRPHDTRSPDHEEPEVVEPSRDVESEEPDDDDHHGKRSVSPSPSADDSGWESPEPEDSGDDEHTSDNR
jgi:hypothetical protein